VALRRENDYHTDLSFSATPPAGGPYFVYKTATLIREGYRADFDGGKPIVSHWDESWATHDADGQVKTYSDDHVSVYRDQNYWRAWYEAEIAAGGDGSSDFSRRFYSLALEYRED